MCVPEGPTPSPVASTVPSMAAASALELGGAGAARGTAGLAREKLRTPAAKKTLPPALVLGTPTGAASAPADRVLSGSAFSVNPALRLGATD